MIKFVLGFVLGAWLLQQQAALANLWWLLALTPTFLLVVKFRSFSFKYADLLKIISTFLLACSLGFLWAATFATIRLSDALPKEWEQKSINVVGVIATLPELTEKGERNLTTRKIAGINAISQNRFGNAACCCSNHAPNTKPKTNLII